MPATANEMTPNVMDLVTARYTTTPFAATEGQDTRYYASLERMRRDGRNAHAALFEVDRGTGNWHRVARKDGE